MNRTFNLAVIQHLIDIQHQDLAAGNVTAKLVLAAGDAISDVLLDSGYQLSGSYPDGREVVHSYINPRTGAVLDDLGFTLEVTDDGNGGPNLSVLLRTDRISHDSPRGFAKPMRTARCWYLPMTNAATVVELLALSEAQKTSPSLEWLLVA